MRRLLLLRPEPGLSASASRARALGLKVISCPLFRVEPVKWEVPRPDAYDAILLTSANAVRGAGPELQRFRELPVHAVGAATAAIAEAEGFTVASVGSRDAADLLATLPSGLRLLHLAGEDVRNRDDPRIDRQTVYRSVEIAEPPLPPFGGLVIAVHSPRAGKRIAELTSERAASAIAAISPAAAAACGQGWERVEAAAHPDDNSLLALAARLCHISPPK